jgi:DNA-binding MarR family transcriptional regulator
MRIAYEVLVNTSKRNSDGKTDNAGFSFAQVALFAKADFRVWSALNRARDSVIKARAVDLASHGLSAPETQILFLVHDAPQPPTPAELGRWALREHNTVSSLLRRMERKGLLLRKRDPDSQNRWRIGLTELGQSEWRWAMQISAIHEVMSGFTPTEKRLLEDLLTKIGNKALARLERSGTRIGYEQPEDGDPGSGKGAACCNASGDNV